VFGLTNESPQNEQTTRNPVYHYGISKNLTDDIIKLYRDKYNLFLCSAILYPHESERRNDNFFSQKIIKESFDILRGKKNKIHIGDIDSFRDVGYAKDYMEACFLIINQVKPDDYVIGSGKSIKNIDFIEKVFNLLGLDVNTQLVFDNTLKREYNLSHLIADNKKIKSIGWTPNKNIDDIITVMINKQLNNNE
jgi:GDPmannose 4,6-dehydratase